MLILGIETSCDETAAAVVENGQGILSNVVASQIDVHKKFGGVVPELASRKHIESINLVVEDALDEAKISLDDINACAVTHGPGLVGSLLIGISFAKGLAYSKGIPLIAINHLEGHIYATYLENPQLSLPAIALIVSGGHTELIQVNEWGRYKLLGRTIDDAVGEAFDKAAKLLNLGYPGGQIIDSLAKKGNPNAVKFPRPLWRRRRFDFSLSGLKTSLIYFLNAQTSAIPSIKDIVASFQEAIVDVLVDKTIKSAQEKEIKNIILCGGVAANTRLKERLSKEVQEQEMRVFYPSPKLCTDNAAMIAGLGYVKYHKQQFAPLSLNANPNLRLENE
ncbi:MAG: tRNA (adenosine(37)-N6)-threonylcarbamoyltransferase complex transferase subunit TsaD [bacterium]